MKLVIVGSGNVAHVLGKLIIDAGHQVLQVVARTPEAAKQTAALLNCDYSSSFSGINQNADLCIIAVSDSAIAEVAKDIRMEHGIVVHTSGSVPANVLQRSAEHFGVLYPLQSIHSNNRHMPRIPFLVNGSSHATEEQLVGFALTLSPIVQIADDVQRMKMHVAAVIVNNFTNHLYTLTQQFCSSEKLDFNLLTPIIEETANRLQYDLPVHLQTGPAKRGDMQTIHRHMHVLDAYPDLKKIYKQLSESIVSFYDEGRQ